MTVFVCTEKLGGMVFNGRRVSRDSEMIKDMLREVGGGVLYVAEFSEKLLSAEDGVEVCRDPLTKAARRGGFCFIEDRGLGKLAKKVDRLIIYNWNRDYPFDMKFDTDPVAVGLRLEGTTEFPGTSHEVITKEVYVR